MSHSVARMVDEALAELAARLVIPCDIIAVHRLPDIGKGRDRKFRSLRYGAFLLTYAALEGFFNNVTGYRAGSTRVLPLNADKIRDAVKEAHQLANVTDGWAARTRVPPTGGTGNRSPWILLTGQRLGLYLRDMQSLRHLLAHGGDPTRADNHARTLNPLAGGGHSIRLMQVEGFIQAAEDLASQTALALGGPQVALPRWPAPPPTEASDTGRLPTPY